MGVTPLMWTALDKHAFFYKHTWMTTAGWDPVKNQLEFYPMSKMTKKLIPYCINTFILIPLGILCCVSILMLKLFTAAPIPLMDILVSGGICLTVITTQILEAVFLFGGANVCIESLDKGCNNILPRDPNGLETYLNSYAALRIIILIAEIEIGTIISTFMGIGMMLCIVFNYGSINLQTILPMSIYVYCPVLAIIVPGAIKVMLPMIVDIYENGKLFVESWKYLLAKTEKKKYLVRRHTWMTTVGWDPVKKTSGISPHLQKLIPYCIDTFVVIPLAIFCCVSILMLKLFSTAQIPLVDILSSGGIGLIVITALILEVVFLCGGTNVVHCTTPSKPKHLDYLGIFLNFAVQIIEVIPFLGMVAFIYFGLDPVYLAQNHVSANILNNWNPSLFEKRLSALQGYLSLRDGGLLLIKILQMCIETLDIRYKKILLRDPMQVEKYLNFYTALRIIILIAEIGTVISTFMAFGMMLCIICNYASIKLHMVLPMFVCFLSGGRNHCTRCN
ncbi:hypothetical protein Fcan01_16836 [Folsomia candida]|uniref:Uncharacterized protein n=1 Tax=Folsomia candida TaxID=158441 RepID=A0A226DRN8_FOLCA|nr:hypothetical protein Fcan01_16836 [Folsomia candida]